MKLDRIRQTIRAARLACIAVLLLICYPVPHANGQVGARPGMGGMSVVEYIYNGQKFQFRIFGGEVHHIMQDNKVLVILSRGNVMVFPGTDPKLAATGQEALKAYQAGTPSGASASATAVAPPQSGLTVDGVVSMLDAGISEDIILAKLHKSGQTFDLSTDDMVRLKKAKASDALMKAMLEATPAPAVSPTPPTTASTAVAAAPPPVAQDAAPAAKSKKPGFFKQFGHDVADSMNGKTVIDKIGLRNILPQWDPEKPLSQQFPHVAITVLYAPMGWTDPYTKPDARNNSIIPPCFKLKAVVWSDAEHSKTIDSFDWCVYHDAMMTRLEPTYVFTLNPIHEERGYLTGINRTDGPAPPTKLLPNDRGTLDMEARTNPQGTSKDLNMDQTSNLAIMFANVRKDLGQTLTNDGDYRVWIVSIKKAAGPSLF